MFSNMKLFTKLSITIVVLILFILSLSFYSYQALKTINDNDTFLYEKCTVPLKILAKLTDAVQRQRSNTLEAVIFARNSEKLDAALKRILARDKEIQQSLKDYTFTYIDSNDRNTWENFINNYNGYRPHIDKLIEIAKIDSMEAALEYYRGDFDIHRKNMTDSLEKIINLNSEAAKQLASHNNNEFTTTVRNLIIVVFVVVLLQIILGGGLTKNVTNQLGGDPLEVMEVNNQLVKGDFNFKINIKSVKENSVLFSTLTVASTIQSLTKDINLLAESAMAGKLDVRVDANKQVGEYKKIIEGVNGTLDAVINPLNLTAEYIDRISKGDIPPKIEEQYLGDFNEIKNNVNFLIDSLENVSNIALSISKGDLHNEVHLRSKNDKLMIAMETMTNSIKNMTRDVLILSQEAIKGNLGFRADSDKHSGDFGTIIKGMNNTLDSIIGPLNVAAEYIDRISKGDIPPRIKDEYMGDFIEIKNNLNSLLDTINALLEDSLYLSEAAVKGWLDVRADASNHRGVYKEIISGVNSSLDSVIGPINEVTNYLEQISVGNIPQKIEKEYFGDFNKLKTSINICIDSINSLVSDANFLVDAAVSGNLSIRADVEHHHGDFRKIVEGVNATLDSLIAPINEASVVLEELSTGNFTVMMEGNYNGDNQKLKMSINTLVTSLNTLIYEVIKVTDTVVSSSDIIFKSTDNMTFTVEQQSHQVTEVASAIEELSKTISENAQGATVTASKANTNGKIANQGGQVVQDTISKMKIIANTVHESALKIRELGESSLKISEIISVIDDIADQTNLLALNAAIEAARAGEQGRGFAVVADEVRKLAERTTLATKEIAVMIKGIQHDTQGAVEVMEQGNEQVNDGIAFADQAGDSLKNIVASSQDVMDMINQIAAATEEQSATSEEVAKVVDSINEAIRHTSINIGEIKNYSAELHDLTIQLKTLIEQFTIDENLVNTLNSDSTNNRNQLSSKKKYLN